MNESQVTLQGWVGSKVDLRETSSGAVATFRLGCTPRYYRNNEWHDGPTSWFTVTAWRSLARNIHDSVDKGDPVTVQGRIRMEQWTPDGEQQPRTTMTVDASVVGHDLTKGTTRFAKPARTAPVDPAAAPSETVTDSEETAEVEESSTLQTSAA